MSSPVATAYVDMKPDFSGFNREVASKLSPIAKNFGGQFGKALGPVMEQQAKHMRTLATGAKYAAAGGAALAVVVGKDLVSAGMKFEKQMSINAAVSEASRKQMGLLERQSIKLGKATFFSATEAAEAQGELVKGGLKVSQVLGGGLPAALSLAEAGQLELAVAAETTVNAMKLFGLQGKEAGSVADMLSTAANRTTADVLDFAMALKQGGSVTKLAGYEMNETVTVLEALAEAGIKNSDAGTSMKTAVIQLLKPSKKQLELTKELNLHWITQNGELKSAAGLSKELHRVTDDMTKAERAKVLATLAGTDGVRTLNALYAETPAQLRALEAANARQGTAQEIANKKMDNFAGTWEQFKGTLETVEIQIYKGIEPALNGLTEEAIQAANRVGAVFENPNLSDGEKVQRALSVLQDEVSRIWDRNEMSEHLLDALDFALNTALPHIAENAGELGVVAVKGFVHGFTHTDLLGKAVMGAWLLNFIGGKAAFVGLGKTAGKQFGLSFASEAALGSHTAAVTSAAAGAAATGALAPGWLGSDSRKERIRLQEAGMRSVARQTAAEALAAQGGIFSTVERDIESRWKGLGGRLARGAASWGLGGLVVGEISREVVGGSTGNELAAAFQGAGAGAAIGSAIAPGIGTAIGAALGGTGGLLVNALTEEADNGGDEWAAAFLRSLEKRLPEISKQIKTMNLGTAPHAVTFETDLGPFEGKKGGSGLRKLRSELVEELDTSKRFGASAEALAAIRAKLAVVTKTIRAGERAIGDYRHGFDLLKSGVVTRMADINKITSENVATINDLWKNNPPKWHAAMAQSMKASIAAVRSGMKQGVIETEVGQKRIKDLTRNLRLFEGRDPLGLAKSFSDSWTKAGQVTSQQVQAEIRELNKMPKGAREAAREAMVGMARTLEREGKLVKGSAARLNSALTTRFGQTNKQIQSSTAKAMANIARSAEEGATNVGGALSNIFDNLSNALAAVGASRVPKFSLSVLSTGSQYHHTREATQSGFGGSPQNKQDGGFIVPGSGDGDRFKTWGEVGAFVMNRKATKAYGLRKGGAVPLALEAGERYFTRPEVEKIGRPTLEAMNRSVPRFGLQKGGGIGPEPKLLGPSGGFQALGQAAIGDVYAGAKKYLGKHSGGLGAMGVHGSVGDHPELQPGISAIIATILKRWPGLQITSTTGGGHATNSLHYQGRAADLGASSAYMLQAAAWIKANLGAQLTEGIHNPNLSIKYGEEVPSGFWGSAVWADHLDHIHAGKQLGGLVQYFAKGGSLGEDFQRKAHRVWGAAASLYGKAGAPMPPMQLRELDGRAGLVYEDQTGVLIDRDWAQKFLRGDDGAESMVPHEWAHMFQNIAKVQATWEREGGAEAFARWADPQIYGALGEPFHYRNITPGYGAYARRVIAEKGWDWVKHGQFKQLGGLVQHLASGGAVVKLAGKILGRHGLDLFSSAGVMGNSYQESGWDTEAMEPGTDNGGLFGFTAGEKSLAAERAFAARQGKPWGDTEAQVQFMLSTLPQSMRDAMNRMGSLEGTTRYFMENWERPNEALANFPRRLEGAKKAVQIFKGMDFEGAGGGSSHIPAEVGYHEKGGETGAGGGTTAPAKGKVKTEKLSDFGAPPDTIAGVRRELTKRRTEIGRYRAALRSNKDPEVKQALEANINLLRNRILALLAQQKRLVHQKAQEAVKKKIAQRGALPAFEEAITSAERAYESASEEAQQIVSLEPEEGPGVKTYIEGREAPAWANVLGTEARWRNALLAGEGAAAVRLRELEAQQERLAALKATNPEAFNKQKYRLPAIREAIASIRQLYQPPQAKSLKDLEAGRFSVIAGGEFEESLTSLQGIGKSTTPMDSLPSEPVAGSWGGLIFDTQMSIRELGLKIKQADEAGGEDNSELLAAIREIAERERKGRFVAERLAATSTAFDNAYPNGAMPPYAGKAHSGTVVPGPPTQERTMTVLGQERIRTPEQELAMAQAIRETGSYGGGMPIVEHHVHGDIVSDHPDPVETVLKDPRTGRVIRRTRGGRVTAGGARR